MASHMRQPSLSANAGGQSPALVARVNEKKAELESLKELRDLSAAAAGQMEALEQKLATLSDGTEGWCFGPPVNSFVTDVFIPSSHRLGVEQLA